MPSVTNALRSESGPFSSRSTSLRGCGTSEKCGSPGLGSGLGEPWKNAARMPLSLRPAMAASVCAGVGLLWHQSTRVVTPWSSWFSAPASVAMWMSSGTNTVARPAWTWRKYSSSVQLAATDRSAVCQVCMWALTRPGSTKCPLQSTTSAPGASSRGAMAAMRSPSTSTSPAGSTPCAASCVTTMPERRSSAMSETVADLHVLRLELHAGGARQLEQQHGEVDVARILVGERLQALARHRRGRHRDALRLGRSHAELHVLEQQLGCEGGGEIEIDQRRRLVAGVHRAEHAVVDRGEEDVARDAGLLGEQRDLAQGMDDHPEHRVVRDLPDARQLTLADIHRRPAERREQRLHRVVFGLRPRGDDQQLAGLGHSGVARDRRAEIGDAGLGQALAHL